ncbi:MAG: DedA family protein [Nanoarchaeota archaeon]|nr:DedA family protein [Nanoarchaeota archaeon]
MELISRFTDLILHVDKYLDILIQNYGTAIYVILFLVIFLETGLVITPFLPGDSLLFIAGTFASQGDMNVLLLFGLLSVAAIIGDSFNYWMGSYLGEKIFLRGRFVKKEYIDKTKDFYQKHGGKTIILARFVPIIRTFAPFVAGIGRMKYSRFLGFNIIGGIAWVGIFLFGGYYFGRIKFVQDNLTEFILLIIFISIIPIIIEVIRNKIKKRKTINTI